MALHYNVAIIPARKRRPKDKAKVELGVRLVQRWILARLRNQVFYSLTTLNAAIHELLIDLNTRPFKKQEAVVNPCTKRWICRRCVPYLTIILN